MKQILIGLTTLVLMSCQNTSVTENKKVSFKIEGMTCEVGCAGLLTRKLNKTEGVTSAKIDFEASKASVGFDSTKVNVSQLVKVVEEAAGGGVYSVSDIQ